MNILKAVIENLAERLAAAKNGRIVTADLLPYLPISLGIVEKHLDEMVDNTVVFSQRHDGFKVYEFSELLGAEPQVLPEGICIYSGQEFDKSLGGCLSPETWNVLKGELLDLAEGNAWPASAVWQHEILYITATAKGPTRIADIAGRSRLTLKQVKEKLRELTHVGVATQNLDYETNRATYEFPDFHYPRKYFLKNDQFIRQHPSSFKDELEVKLVKSLSSVTIVALSCFLLTFILRGAFVPLVFAGSCVSVFIVWRIFTKKSRVEPGRIGRNGNDNS